MARRNELTVIGRIMVAGENRAYQRTVDPRANRSIMCECGKNTRAGRSLLCSPCRKAKRAEFKANGGFAGLKAKQAEQKAVAYATLNSDLEEIMGKLASSRLTSAPATLLLAGITNAKVLPKAIATLVEQGHASVSFAGKNALVVFPRVHTSKTSAVRMLVNPLLTGATKLA